MDFFIFVSEQWLLISLLIALIGVFLFTEQGKSGKSISPAELVRLMNSEEAVVVDVRSAGEFESGHIHGSRNIPHGKLASRIAELEKYIMGKDDKTLYKWWANFLESKSDFTNAHLAYEKAGDYASQVRLHCLSGDFAAAEEICTRS